MRALISVLSVTLVGHLEYTDLCVENFYKKISSVMRQFHVSNGVVASFAGPITQVILSKYFAICVEYV